MKIQYLLNISLIAMIIFALGCNPKNSALRIKADQENAKVIIDGEEVGTVPLDVMVSAGEHTVEVYKEVDDENWYYYKEKINIGKDVSKSIRATLKKQLSEKLLWEKVLGVNDLEGYKRYLDAFPKGFYVKEANRKFNEILWEKAISENSIKSYEEYLKYLPDGNKKEVASQKLEELFWQRAIKEKDIQGYGIYLSKFPNSKHSKEAEKQYNLFFGTYTDKRDGNIYKTVKIGNQIWMTENLRYKTNSGSWAYNNDTTNIAKYGRLYNWDGAKKACPEGWHLPTFQEWCILADYIQENSNINGKDIGKYSSNSWEGVGTELKAKSDWNLGSHLNGIRGTNIYGFNALPSGYWHDDARIKAYRGIGSIFYCWSGTYYNKYQPYYFYIDYRLVSSSIAKGYRFCIRCIKD